MRVGLLLLLALGALASPLERRQALYQWLLDGGADIARVAIADSPHGSGLFATRDVAAGEDVVRVPSELCISTRTLWRTPQLRDALEAGRGQLEDYHRDAAAIMLAYHALLGRESFFSPYVASLPGAAELEGAHLLTATDPPPSPELLAVTGLDKGLDLLQRKAALTERFISTHPELFPSAEPWLARWAVAVTAMRAWGVNGVRTLMPLIDLFNHDSRRGGSQRNVQEADGGIFSLVTADAPTRVGDELFVRYGAGDTCETDFVKNFGFADASLSCLSPQLQAFFAVDAVAQESGAQESGAQESGAQESAQESGAQASGAQEKEEVQLHSFDLDLEPFLAAISPSPSPSPPSDRLAAIRRAHAMVSAFPFRPLSSSLAASASSISAASGIDRAMVQLVHNTAALELRVLAELEALWATQLSPLLSETGL